MLVGLLRALSSVSQHALNGRLLKGRIAIDKTTPTIV